MLKIEQTKTFAIIVGIWVHKLQQWRIQEK